MEARMVKDALLSIRVAPALKDALQDLADKDRRSLSTYIEIALEKHVGENAASLENMNPRSTERAKATNVRRRRSLRRIT
jgi:predicted DNA-binding protein